jgi:hypothetical protein
MPRRTFRFSLLIVLIAACAVASIPLAIESISVALSPSPPTRMPWLPQQADAIIGIRSEYFFQATLTVRTTDGLIYTTDGHAWQRTDQSYPANAVSSDSAETFRARPWCWKWRANRWPPAIIRGPLGSTAHLTALALRSSARRSSQRGVIILCLTESLPGEEEGDGAPPNRGADLASPAFGFGAMLALGWPGGSSRCR